MFSLFYGLWQHVFSKAEFHVVILGVHKAGKTVIILKLTFTFIFVPASICFQTLSLLTTPNTIMTVAYRLCGICNSKIASSRLCPSICTLNAAQCTVSFDAHAQSASMLLHFLRTFPVWY
jgi:hypothetical protein